MHEPERLVAHEALHILAAYERQILTELLAVEVEQHAAVADFFFRHFIEYLGGGGILLAQTIGEAAIDAAVFLFIGDRKREDFLLGQIGETFHGGVFSAFFWLVIFLFYDVKAKSIRLSGGVKGR